MIVVTINKAEMLTQMMHAEQMKQKRKELGPKSVLISNDLLFCIDRNYKSVMTMYCGAGFTNVKAVPLNDLYYFSFGMNENVERVIINGSSEFQEGDVFPKDANVLINYHSIRNN